MSASPGNASLQLGTATVNVSPPVGMWMGGYADRRRPSEALHDDLYGTALVFDDGQTRAALVTVDVLGLARTSVATVRRLVDASTGIPGDHVLVTCSHTHSGPVTGAYDGEPADPGEYLRELERKLAGAVLMASRRLRPVIGGYAQGSHRLAINRRATIDGRTRFAPNPLGPVDHALPVLRLDELDGYPAAVVFGYACHASLLGPDNYAFSADYPGATRAFVQAAYGAVARGFDAAFAGDGGGRITTAFVPGCCGDTKGNVAAASARQGTRSGGATFAELASVGRSLGAEVVRTREAIVPAAMGGVAVASRIVTMPLRPMEPLPVFRAAVESGVWPDTGDRMSAFQQSWARRILERLEAGERPPAVEAELQAIRVGSVVFMSFPGEIFTEIGLQVRERVWVEAGLHAVPCTLANGSIGYVPTAREIPRGGYEVNASRMHSMAGYSGAAEPLLVDTAVALARAVAA